MIDIENEIFTGVRATVLAEYSNATVTSMPINQPASFPFVLVSETDNYTYKKSADGASIENHAVIVYTVEVYSDDKTDKKSQAKAIVKLIDNYFATLGFRRRSNAHLYSEDKTLYRMITRYEGVVGTNKKIYRR